MANMTDEMMWFREDDPFDDGVCPVCGGTNVMDTEHETENDTYLRRMTCGNCGSEWTHTYWIANTLVTMDGRYEEE